MTLLEQWALHAICWTPSLIEVRVGDTVCVRRRGTLDLIPEDVDINTLCETYDRVIVTREMLESR